jgi:hypothetical protein
VDRLRSATQLAGALVQREWPESDVHGNRSEKACETKRILISSQRLGEVRFGYYTTAAAIAGRIWRGTSCELWEKSRRLRA